VEDMDNDGDPDIVAGEVVGEKRALLYENLNNGSSWSEYVISHGTEQHYGSRVVDMDNDGDFDFAGIAWFDNHLLHLWRNDALTGGPVTGSVLMDSHQDPYRQNFTLEINDDRLQLEILLPQRYVVTLWDISGKTVGFHKGKGPISSSMCSMFLRPGIYILKVIIGKDRFSRRIYFMK
jgi:hypothetical protein